MNKSLKKISLRNKALLSCASLLFFLPACFEEDVNQSTEESMEISVLENPGNSKSFSHLLDSMSKKEQMAAKVGRSFFRSAWVTAPASTTALDGLGPLFNAISCLACHEHNGRGRPPIHENEDAMALLFRLSISDGNYGIHTVMENKPSALAGDELFEAQAATEKAQHFTTKNHPRYGGQLNRRALTGVAPEAKVHISYEEIPGTYADGTPYSLRKPRYQLGNLAYGALEENTLISPRIAPAMIGLGLLEAIPAEDIIALADPDDANNDGISGRAHMVWDKTEQRERLGRFGWKATQPSVRQQVAAAFVGDIGITSSVFPDENHTVHQHAAHTFPNGGTPELQEHILKRVTLYCQSLAVPERRNQEHQQIQKGRALFEKFNCISCHVESFTTVSNNPDTAFLDKHTIYPYSDLLLHDMGPALSDARPDDDANTHEWRTAPLWSLGLVERVNKHSFLMHDGRARNISEAILWHGGEAEAAKEAFRQASAEEREALLAFLESL